MKRTLRVFAVIQLLLHRVEVLREGGPQQVDIAGVGPVVVDRYRVCVHTHIGTVWVGLASIRSEVNQQTRIAVTRYLLRSTLDETSH
jgi:hypothetical protein